jgi:hypothetical protein
MYCLSYNQVSGEDMDVSFVNMKQSPNTALLREESESAAAQVHQTFYNLN